MNPQVKDIAEGEIVLCPDCGAKMLAFPYSRDGMDVEYGLGCSKCERRDY